MYIEFGLNTLLGKMFGDKLPDFEQVLGIFYDLRWGWVGRGFTLLL